MKCLSYGRQWLQKLLRLFNPLPVKLPPGFGRNMASWPDPNYKNPAGGAEPLGNEFVPGAFAVGMAINIKRPRNYMEQYNRPSSNMTPDAACQSNSMGASCSGTQVPGTLMGGESLVGFKRPAPPSVRVSLDVEANSSFSEALRHVVNGGHAARAGWNGPGQYVFAQYPDKGSKMTAPYLVLHNSQGGFLPWAPSQGDVFARDWALLPSRLHDVS